MELDYKSTKREMTKLKRVAPLCNKGAYQVLTNDTDPTTLGRKI